VTAHELFEFHADVANLPAITPPFPPFRLLGDPKRAEVGDRQVLRLGWDRLGVTWTAKVTRVVTDRLTEDVQEEGPFIAWRHQHQFADSGPGTAVLTDVVAFRLLPSPVGEFIEYFTVRPMLLGLFRYRHRKTRTLLEHHNRT
jgi:ligand-binding SRPBCC domain-containing protein